MDKYKNLDELFTDKCQAFPDSTLQTSAPDPSNGYKYHQLTFSDLSDLVDRLASSFVNKFDIEEGDRVAIIGRPHPQWAASFFAAFRVGAVAVPISYNFTSEEIRRVLNESEAKLAVVQSDKHSVVAEKFTQLAHLDNLVVYGGEAEEGFRTWGSYLTEERYTERAGVERKDTAVLMYTSGTTGHGKGVMLSHENLLVNLSDIGEALDIGPDDSLVSILPWDHIYGLTTTLLVPFDTGASMVYTVDYRNLPKVLKKKGGTILLGVPKLLNTLYEEIMTKIESSWWKKLLYKFFPAVLQGSIKKKLAGEKFRFAVSGGAPLNPETGSGLRELGIGVMEGYGLTETSPVLTFTPDPFTDKTGTVGQALPSVELRLRETDDKEINEVLARGPNVMKGYYKNSQKTDEVLEPDGWFHTGDSGTMDEDDWLYLNGRMKNVIVLESGNNVYA
ncbi:MAG: AMP-binding protein, partial [Candidatus Bipolaricaulota bacterium]